MSSEIIKLTKISKKFVGVNKDITLTNDNATLLRWTDTSYVLVAL